VPITFDETRYPLLSIAMVGTITGDEIDAYHARLEVLMKRARDAGTKLGFVVDGRSSEPPGARDRRKMVEFLEKNSGLLASAVFGEVIVLSNAIQRGVLTAILWVRPFPIPHYVCATPAEGLAWLEARLGKAA
jgi:hypothetical protein